MTCPSILLHGEGNPSGSPSQIPSGECKQIAFSATTDIACMGWELRSPINGGPADERRPHPAHADGAVMPE